MLLVFANDTYLHDFFRGFLMISDGVAGETGNWIEEALAITLIQFIASHQKEDKISGSQETFGAHAADLRRSKAKLIKIPGIHWEVDFSSSPQRRERHRQKMITKHTRAQRQLQLLGIPVGQVQHIKD